MSASHVHLGLGFSGCTHVRTPAIVWPEHPVDSAPAKVAATSDSNEMRGRHLVA